MNFVDLSVGLLDIFDGNRQYSRNINSYFKWREQNKKKFDNMLYRLQKQGVIKKYNDNGETSIELTIQGQKKLRGYLIEELNLKKAEVWDKKWRVVMFDIPNENKLGRRLLRMKLLSLGFKKLQESVFIFPYECEAEINLITEYYEVRKFVNFLLVDTFDEESKYLNKFIEDGII